MKKNSFVWALLIPIIIFVALICLALAFASDDTKEMIKRVDKEVPLTKAIAKKSNIPNPLIDLKTGKCLENCDNVTGYFDVVCTLSQERD